MDALAATGIDGDIVDERKGTEAIVDDATGWTSGEFFESETTHASYDTLEGWIDLYGAPGSLYVPM